MLKKEISEENAHQSGWMNLVVILLTSASVGTIFTVVAYYSPPSMLASKQPHIIFILIDDLGWNDVSFHGSPQIATPNLDALAAGGVILNNYYTHPQCTPSRGALLTGRYANRIGLQHDVLRPTQPAGLPLDFTILPQYLKELGYRTHMVGKWHLGYHRKEFLPTRRGFDSFFGNLNDYLDYYDYTVFSDEKPLPSTNQEEISDGSSIDENSKGDKNPKEAKNKSFRLPSMFGIDLWENEDLVTDIRGEYITDLYTRRAIEVISQHNSTKPLFLLLSFTACQVGNVYFPLQAPPDQVNKHAHIDDINRRTFAGMVSSVDDGIGQIFKALDRKGMLRKSVMVVSSDNGGAANGFKGSASSNWPLRGMKYDLWEGGVKSTGLIWSPLLLLEEPRTSMKLMHISDWFPTLYKLAGGNVEDVGEIDGVDMWPALMDENTASPRTEVLLNIDPIYGMAAIRSGDMKLLMGSYPSSENGWYGPTGDESGNSNASMDAWIWRNGSDVRDVLLDSGRWLLVEEDSWRSDAKLDCGVNFLPETGKCDFVEGPCLYNITDDPCEFKNLATLFPEVVESMLNRIRKLNESSAIPVTSELDAKGDPRCRDFVYGPWLDDEDAESCPWV